MVYVATTFLLYIASHIHCSPQSRSIQARLYLQTILLFSLPLSTLRKLSTMAASHDDKRWEGVQRLYTKQDVEKLRGSMKIEYTLARQGAERLWKLLHTEPYIHALGALTGNQAVQQVQGKYTC